MLNNIEIFISKTVLCPDIFIYIYIAISQHLIELKLIFLNDYLMI